MSPAEYYTPLMHKETRGVKIPLFFTQHENLEKKETMLHKVLFGTHKIKNTTYRKGETFEYPADLSLLYLNKFKIILPPPVKVEIKQIPPPVKVEIKQIPKPLKKVIIIGPCLERKEIIADGYSIIELKETKKNVKSCPKRNF